MQLQGFTQNHFAQICYLLCLIAMLYVVVWACVSENPKHSPSEVTARVIGYTSLVLSLIVLVVFVLKLACLNN